MIALRILLILNDSDLPDQKVEEAFQELLTSLDASKKNYYSFLSKLDHYMQIRFKPSDHQQALLLLLTPMRSSLFTSGDSAAIHHLSMAPKVRPSVASVLKLTLGSQDHKHKEEKIPINLVAALTELPRGILLEQINREQATEELHKRISALGSDRSTRDTVKNLRKYMEIVNQKGWSCIEPIIVMLIEKFKTIKDFEFKSPFAGTPFKDNFNEAFIEFLSRAGLNYSDHSYSIDPLFSLDIHGAVALSSIFLQVVRAYEHPQLQQPSAALQRVTTIVVRNLNKSLQPLCEYKQSAIRLR